MLRRLTVVVAVFATALLLLFLKNKVLLGHQDLEADLRPVAAAAAPEAKTRDYEVLFKDVAGGLRDLDPERDWPVVKAELVKRFKKNDAKRWDEIALSGEPRMSADKRVLITAPSEVPETTLRSRLSSRPFPRPNEPRSLLHITRGIDIRGGVEFICRLKDPDNRQIAADDEVVHILRERLDERGLSEPQVSRLSNGDVQVIIPGGTTADAARTRRVLETAGRLEFREVLADYGAYGARERQQNWPGQNYPGTIPGDAQCAAVLKPNGTWAFAPGVPRNRGDILLPAPKREGADDKPSHWLRLGPVALVGKDVESANAGLSDGKLAVDITFTAIGAVKNAEFTRVVKDRGDSDPSNNTGRIAIIFDNEVKSDPIIINPSGKNCQITGLKTQDEIDALKSALKGGSLAVTPEVLSERVVGASLGEDAVDRTVTIRLVAILSIVLLMFVYYRRLGLVANLCLLATGVLVYATLSVFDATVTLPGLAGLVLIIGMAVDTNILIFERIREELKEDKGIKAAIEAGYGRAFWTIFDSHLTTLATAFILYWIGTGPVKGFGLTLMIGIVVNLFSGVYIGRLITDWLCHDAKSLGMASWVPALRLPYVRWRWFAYVLSIVTAVIGLGWFAFGHHIKGGTFERNFDIDFTGGSMAQAVFKSALSADEIKTAIQAAYDKLPADQRAASLLHPDELRVQAYFADFAGNHDQSRQWVFRVRDDEGTRLEREKSELEAQRAAVQREIDHLADNDHPDRAAMERITREQARPLDDKIRAKAAEVANRTTVFKNELAAAFPGKIGADGDELLAASWKERTLGLRIATVDPVPDEASKNIAARLAGLAQITIKPLADGNGMDVTATFAEQPKAAPGIEIEDKAGAHLESLFEQAGQSKDDARAEALVALDLTNRIVDAAASFRVTVARPFPATEHFSGQVADRMKTHAFIALLLSLLVIMAYVAARFEFRFGIGAVVALVHDVLMTIGLVTALGIRIDLTVVAALLTIIGATINETIVVYDRIRENLKRTTLPLDQVIDLSISQTMARTVLTTGTVVITLVTLLIFGGEALKPFTATLLIGICSGFYSSIFVAAPLLLSFKSKMVKAVDSDAAGDPGQGAPTPVA